MSYERDKGIVQVTFGYIVQVTFGYIVQVTFGYIEKYIYILQHMTG